RKFLQESIHLASNFIRISEPLSELAHCLDEVEVAWQDLIVERRVPVRSLEACVDSLLELQLGLNEVEDQEVPDLDGRVLALVARSIEPTYPLLEHHRVPGEVEMKDNPRVLQVLTDRERISADQNGYLSLTGGRSQIQGATDLPFVLCPCLRRE